MFQIPKVYWLFLPIIWLIGQFILELTLSSSLLLKMHAEGSIHETLQFGMVSTACLISLYTLIKLKPKEIWKVFWLLLTAICCFYVAIEEVSYGQSFFNWSTPEYWQNINSQAETNLHNTSRWLNQIPRYCLMGGIAIGGFIVPLINYTKPSWLPKKFHSIYPTAHFTITATCLLIVALGHKLSKTFLGTKLFERASEVEEIFIYFFVLLYTLYVKDQFLKKAN